MITPPCKECKDRIVGCHSECEKYKNWKDYKDKANEHHRAYFGMDYYIRDRYERK